MNSIDSIPQSTVSVESEYQPGAEPQVSDPAVLTALRNLIQDPKTRLQALRMAFETKTKELTTEFIKADEKSAQAPEDKKEVELQASVEKATVQQALSGQHFVISFSPTGLPISPKSVGNGAVAETVPANVSTAAVAPEFLPTTDDLKSLVSFLKTLETSLSKKEPTISSGASESSEISEGVNVLPVLTSAVKVPVTFKPAPTTVPTETPNVSADVVEVMVKDVVDLLESFDPKVLSTLPGTDVLNANVVVNSEVPLDKTPSLAAFFTKELNKGVSPEQLDVKLEEAVVFLKALIGNSTLAEKPALSVNTGNPSLPTAPTVDTHADANVVVPTLAGDDQIDVKLQKAIVFLESARTAIAAGTFAENTPVQEPAAEVPETSLGASILQFLNQQSSHVTAPLIAQTSEGVAVNVADRVGQIETLMTEMAERVLVTDPLHGQTPEVRIKLAENILPGTEVRVWRGDGGQVNVTFHTTSPESAKVLTEVTDALAQRLNEKMPTGEPALVSIETSNESPGDGRSRQRFNPWDMMNNEDDKG